MYGLTPREEQIMNTIWNMDHPCLISEILKASPFGNFKSIACFKKKYSSSRTGCP